MECERACEHVALFVPPPPTPPVLTLYEVVRELHFSPPPTDLWTTFGWLCDMARAVQRGQSLLYNAGQGCHASAASGYSTNNSSTNRRTNRSTNYSTNNSRNRSTNRSTNSSTNRSTDRSTNSSTNRSTNSSTNSS